MDAPQKRRGQEQPEPTESDGEDDKVSPPRTPPPASASQGDRTGAKPLPAAARSIAAEQAPDAFEVVPMAVSDSDSDVEVEEDKRAAAEVRKHIAVVSIHGQI